MIETTVKWFSRGWGFANCPNGGPDIFLHYTAIISEQPFRNLVEGERVRLEVEVTEKGRAAISVVSLEAPTP